MAAPTPPVPLTRAGRDALRAELDQLTGVRRPEIVRRISETRQEGDLSENAGYHQAREDQSHLEGRIAELEAVLGNHVLIEEGSADGSVRLGTRVVVADEFGETEYLIVGPQEADPTAGRISASSPVGAALLGARAGDTVSVATPSGSRSMEVRRVG
jgi:transcription elongation factor GreA